MNQYGNFAYVYDQLMDDVDYDAWVGHIEDLIDKSGASVKNILELACGTGNITIPLAQRGYDIAGVDISEDMLGVALEKSESIGLPLVLLEQDMVDLDFDLYDLDCVLCACDGFNYVTSLDDLAKVFAKVYELLKPGGVFVFDISSHYKLSQVLGNNFMGESREDISYMWTNYYDEGNQLLEMNLDFFLKIDDQDYERDEYEEADQGSNELLEDGSQLGCEDDNLYERYREVHLQRAHKEDEIVDTLKNVGFEKIDSYGDFGMDRPGDKAERIFFTAVK